MIFSNQRRKFVNKDAGEKLLFYGTTREPMADQWVVNVIGVKQADGAVHALVHYLEIGSQTMEPEVRLDTVLTPGEFEKLLHQINHSLFREDENKLVDITPAKSFKSLDDFTEEDEFFLNLLYNAVSAISTQEVGFALMEEFLEEIIGGHVTPIQTVQRLEKGEPLMRACKTCTQTSCPVHPANREGLVQ